MILRALGGTFPDTLKLTIAVSAVFITVVYGASDELHQSFVPGRDSDLLDVIADGGGASVVAAIWLFWKGKKAG